MLPCRIKTRAALAWLMGCITIASAQSPKLVLPVGHTDNIYNLTFSPNDKFLISDPGGLVWDVQSGKFLFKTGESYCVFSPNEKWILYSANDSTSIWDVASAKVIKRIPGRSPIYQIFSPDGKYMATTVSKDFGFTLIIWKTDTWEQAHEFPDLEWIEFDQPWKNLLVTKDGKCFLIDLSTKKTLLTWEGRGPNFNPNGKEILSGKNNSDVLEIRDRVTGKLKWSLPDVRNFYGLNAQGSLLLVSHTENTNRKDTVTCYQASTGKKKYEVSLQTKESIGVALESVSFSPDGESILLNDMSDGGEIRNADDGSFFKSMALRRNEIGRTRYSKLRNYMLISSGRLGIIFIQPQSGQLYHKAQGKWTPIEILEPFTSLVDIAFSNNEKLIAVATDKNQIEVYELPSLRHRATLGGSTSKISKAQLAEGGNNLLVRTEDQKARIWNFEKGTLMQSWNHQKYIPTKDEMYFEETFQKVILSPDGQWVGTFKGDTAIYLYNIPKQQWVKTPLTAATPSATNLYFTKDSKALIALSQYDEWMDIYTLATNEVVRATNALSPTYSHETKVGNRLVVQEERTGRSYRDMEVKIFQISTGKLLKGWEVKDSIVKVLISPDERKIVTVNRNRTARVLDATNLNVLTTLEGRADMVFSFTPSGDVISGKHGDALVSWDVLTGKKITHYRFQNSNRKKEIVNESFFSEDGKKIFGLFFIEYPGESRDSLFCWDVKSGQQLKGFGESGYTLLHEKAGASQFITEYQSAITTWDAATGSKKKSINLDSYASVLDVDLLKSKALVQANSVLQWIDLESGNELVSWILLDSANWIVTHPSGLFDASPAAMDKLYFVQGLDIIGFSQLKERYYEPGLWKKVMTGEKLRNVVGMKSIELPPDIHVGQVDDKGYLPIELINRGGGIGEVTVLINGKEAIADARPQGGNSKSATLSLKAFIGTHKALIKGAENFITVKVWNEGHWVVSRGAMITYSPKGNETAYKPAIHIIACGVSDYTGTELDLKYAAKDAEDVSKALQLGAKKLFGTDRSFVYNLTTTQPTSPQPSKTTILKTFEKISTTAHPLDIVVVYLSGHGINHGGQEGDWYYLTQEAYTSSSAAYNDPEIRKRSTLSSSELVELFKKVPASKQVLMIDACASGKVVESLMAKKDIESSTLRALDRMRDRTGLHIITGCTADAVSYEASKYGQGVLTYSLLEGIRGAALREDQFIDINKLFQYAHDRVPLLAEGIGGIQTPQVFSPQGAQSFDIGQLAEEEKKAIPIAKIRPVYIRSSFIDDDQLEDALQLGKKIDEALNEVASKGPASGIIFVDVREYPEGCKLSGRYTQVNGVITLKLRKKCEGKDETLSIEGKTVGEITEKILGLL